MEITGIGIGIIILSLFGLFNRNFLYYLNIFFIPFSATAIFNIGKGDNASAIQAYMYLAVLNIIFMVQKNFKNINKINVNEWRIIKFLMLFIIAAIISLISLNFIEGKFTGNQTGTLYMFSRIYFSSKNVTQLLYLILGFLFSLVVYNHAKQSPKNFIITLRVYVFSLVFVTLWAWMELYCYTTGMEYPKEIFNTNANKSAQGIGAILDGGIRRVSSVAVEASVLAQVFLIIMPFLFFDYFSKSKVLFKSQRDLILFGLFFTSIFLTASSSGFLSLIILFISMGYFFLREKSSQTRFIWFSAIIFISVCTIFALYYSFKNVFDAAIFDKGSSMSALERSLSIKSAYKNFTQYPIFGVGWGSVTSFDLIVRLLSNTGLLGTLFFVIFVYKVMRAPRSKTFGSNQNLANKFIIPSVLSAFIAILFNNAISGFTFIFGHIWFVFGLSYITTFRKGDAL